MGARFVSVMLLAAAGTVASPAGLTPPWAAPGAGAAVATDQVGRQKLAVLELHDDAGVGDVAARFLSERLRGAALALPERRWFVVTRENLVALLPPGVSLADCLADCEVDTGRRIGADVIVTGQILSFDGRLRAVLNAHRVDTGQLVSQQVAVALDLGGLEAALDAAANRLYITVAGAEAVERGSGTLSVTGRLGLSVAVDERSLGTLPLISSRLPAGEHLVVVESPCHERATAVVQVKPGQALAIELNPPPLTASVRFKVTDAERQRVPAAVIADGSRLGATPGPLAVPVCTRALSVESTGSFAQHRVAVNLSTLRLVPNAFVELPVRFAPPARPAEPVEPVEPVEPARPSTSRDPPLRILNPDDYPIGKMVGVVCGLFALIGVVTLIAGASPSEDTSKGEANQALALGGALTGLGLAGVVGLFIYFRSEREVQAAFTPAGPAVPALPAWTPGLSLSVPF